jgi:hypothetical protein
MPVHHLLHAENLYMSGKGLLIYVSWYSNSRSISNSEVTYFRSSVFLAAGVFCVLLWRIKLGANDRPVFYVEFSV